MREDKNLNGLILLNKPKGKTSHDMVSFIRKLFQTRRVGHTGTLDPDATGVLPICIGVCTKASQYIMDSAKTYVARMQLGSATTTQDASGDVTYSAPVCVTEQQVREVITSFVGELEQIPPMYSAVKVGGRKLYELARAGLEIERKPRKITIHNIYIFEIDLENNSVLLEVDCSKGTYIRTLIHDIGEKLGCYAHMTSLIRTKSCGFVLEDTYTCEQLEEMQADGTLAAAVVPTQAVFHKYPSVVLDAENTKRVKNGIPIRGLDVVVNERYRVFDNDEHFLCVSVGCADGSLKMITSFWSE